MNGSWLVLYKIDIMKTENYITKVIFPRIPSFFSSTLSLMTMLLVLWLMFISSASVLYWIKIDLPDWIVAVVTGVITTYYNKYSKNLLSDNTQNDTTDTPTVQG